jgi:hypothetical protein
MTNRTETATYYTDRGTDMFAIDTEWSARFIYVTLSHPVGFTLDHDTDYGVADDMLSEFGGVSQSTDYYPVSDDSIMFVFER